MDHESALLFSQSICAMLRGMGMMGVNLQRVHRGESLAFDDKAFEEVINEFGIGWNNAIITLRG